jgi:hypothetical protein
MYTDRIKLLLKQYHLIKLKRDKQNHVERNYGLGLARDKLKEVEAKMFGEDELGPNFSQREEEIQHDKRQEHSSNKERGGGSMMS